MTTKSLVDRLWLRSYNLVNRLSRRGIDEHVSANLQDVCGLALNLGCGSRALAFPTGLQEVSLDISRRRSPDIQGDACSLPFVDHVFDAIVSTEVLEHLHDPQGAVDEIWRVLKSGGIAIITAPFMFQIHDAPYDYFRFTRYGLELLFKDFQDITVSSRHSGYLALLTILGRLQMEKAVSFRWMSLPLAIAVWMLSKLDPIATRVFPIETVTTGYFVVCRK